jgi:N-acetylglucosamine-6-phosphate deacetylase
MTPSHRDGRILSAEGWVDGRIHFDGGIRAIEPGAIAADAPTILPGFVDLHCHGGGGADAMDGEAALRRLARLHARHGTTTLLATTMTAPVAEIEAALAGAAAVIGARQPGEARVSGVHLEGPFISPDRLGAQPPFAVAGDSGLMDRFRAAAPIVVVTWAPEADPDGHLRRDLQSRGIRVQLGHSNCDYETAAAAFADGTDGVTHLFNAMTGLHHRAPGIVGAALAHAVHGEIIPDLIHVHPGAIRAALRAIPGLHAVTDATAAAGMPDGDYRLGRHAVRKCGNGVRLADGTLAGSSLTMDRAFANLIAIGLSLEEASRRCSTLAADYLGLADRGRIAAGAMADLVLLDRELAVRGVFVEGEAIDLADAG